MARVRVNGIAIPDADSYYDRIKDESSLVAYFPLSEDVGADKRVLDTHGGRVADVTSSPVVVSNGVPYGDKSLDFDGTDDKITIADDGLVNGVSQFTFECWLNLDSQGTFAICDSRKSTTHNWYLYTLSGSLRLGFHDGSAVNTITSATLSADTWYHVAVRYDGTKADVFVNGVLNGSATDTYATDVPDAITLGSNGSSAYLDGSIAHAAFYNAALSQAKINRHYSAYADAVLQLAPVSYWRLNEPSGTVATDLGSAGNDGTHTSVTRLDEAGALADDPAGSTGYDGSADYTTVSFDAAYATTALTVACFMRMDASHAGTGLCFHCTESSYTEGWALWFNSSDQLNARVGSDAHLTGALNEEQWYYVVMTHDGTTKKTYVDGVEVDSVDVAVGTLNSAGDLHIGAGEGGALKHKGNVQEATYFNKALSASEVAHLSNLALQAITDRKIV